VTPLQCIRCVILAIVIALLLTSTGCGYHTAGQAVRLPTDLHTLYVPTFVNGTSIYRIEQTITEDVIRELRDRTHYRIVTTNQDGDADATLTGAVTAALITPMTYDPATGRISSGMVTVSMKASLVTKKGKVLWDNPNYLYREQYQVSRDAPSFFEEEEPALGRVANNFAQALVSDILEAY
jgi:hypothetical protein